jgi:hypothetical protein
MPDAAQALWPNGPSSMLGNEELTRASMKKRPDDQEDSGHATIDNFRNDPGLFGPIAEDMKGPFKEYADKAAAMTKHMYDLYKSGDPDVRKVVGDWEKKHFAAGYADNEAGNRLAVESMEKYGSKSTMGHEAMWEAYMSHYGNLLTDAGEREDIPADKKAEFEEAGRFDRGGRNEMDMRKINAKLSAQYGRGKGV